MSEESILCERRYLFASDTVAPNTAAKTRNILNALIIFLVMLNILKYEWKVKKAMLLSNSLRVSEICAVAKLLINFISAKNSYYFCAITNSVDRVMFGLLRIPDVWKYLWHVIPVI